MTWISPSIKNAEGNAEPVRLPARARHREMLTIATVVALFAFALTVLPGGRVAVRGLERFPLPESCVSKSVFHFDCPGCGLTRSIVYFAHGQWTESFHVHHLGWLMAIIILIQIPYRIAALRRPERPLIPKWIGNAVGWTLIALLLGNWVMNLLV